MVSESSPLLGRLLSVVEGDDSDVHCNCAECSTWLTLYHAISHKLCEAQVDTEFYPTAHVTQYIVNQKSAEWCSDNIVDPS